MNNPDRQFYLHTHRGWTIALYTHPPVKSNPVRISRKGLCIVFRATGALTFPYTTMDTPDTLTPKTMSDLAKILHRAILDMANSEHNFFESK